MTQPGGAPAGATWRYAVAGQRNNAAQSGICNIDTDGTVSATADALADDLCVVTATASATGYTDKVAPTASLTVSSDKPLTITWADYSPSSLTWTSGGVTAPTFTAPTVADGDSNAVSSPAISFTYSVGSATTNNSCSVNNGTLTINGAGTCQVELTVEDNNATDNINYVTKTVSKTVTINKGTQSFSTANVYGNSPTLKYGTTLSKSATPSGGAGEVVYTSTTGSVCSVDEDSGLVTPEDSEETCTVTAHWSGDDDFLASVPVEVLSITIAKGDITVETNNWSYTSIRVGTGAYPPTSFASVPSDATREYTSDTPTVCRVTNPTGGNVEGLLNQSCTVVLTLTKEHYNDKVARKTFSILPGTITVAGATEAEKWGGEYTSVTVGSGTSTAPTVGEIDPAGTAKSYTAVDDLCSVTSPQGVVTGLDDGTCTVRLTISKAGYTDLTHDYDVGVNEGTLTAGSLTAPGYTAALRVGGNAVPVTTQPGGTPAGVTASWAYSAVGKRAGTETANICSVHNTNGAVTAGSAALSGDTCEITARVTATGYAQADAPVTTLTVSAGAITVTNQGTYAAVTVGENATAAPALTGLSPISAQKAYTTASSGQCSVDPDSGAVTGLDDGTDNCVVQLTLTATNYASTTLTYTISVQEGTMGTLTAPAYASTDLSLSGSGQAVATGPSGAPDGAVWEYGAVGKRGGSVPNPPEDICDVDENGLVTVGADAQINDTCEVTATAAARGYPDTSADMVAFDIVGGIAVAWTGYSHGGTPTTTLRLDQALTLNHPTATVTPAAAVQTSYAIHSSSQATAGRTQDPCSVVSATGSADTAARWNVRGGIDGQCWLWL